MPVGRRLCAGREAVVCRSGGGCVQVVWEWVGKRVRARLKVVVVVRICCCCSQVWFWVPKRLNSGVCLASGCGSCEMACWREPLVRGVQEWIFGALSRHVHGPSWIHGSGGAGASAGWLGAATNSCEMRRMSVSGAGSTERWAYGRPASWKDALACVHWSGGVVRARHGGKGRRGEPSPHRI